MANGTFCYLVLIIAVVKSRNRNMMTFMITIKAIMTVREMTWLTCSDFKMKVHLCQNISIASGQKVRFWR